MTLRLLVAALAASAACTGVEAARLQKPARLVPSWKQSHFEEANPFVRSVYRYAVCARLYRRESAEALLATRPGSAEEAALIATMLPPNATDCPMRKRKPVKPTRILMRGAVSEAFYNGEHWKPRRRISALPLDGSLSHSPRSSKVAVARWVARCAVRREPHLTHSMLKYNPGGVGETRSLRALKPVFLACLPDGERLRVSRLNIRALIAEELYLASRSFKTSFANARS